MSLLRIFFFAGIAVCVLSCSQSVQDNTDWSAYQGGTESNQYSTLNQINTDNVQNLKVAWRYEAGDTDPDGRSQIQCNPLIIDGVLYGSTPVLKFFALDAATGKEIWKFDPFGGQYDQFGMGVNRGMAYWESGGESRILFTAGSFIYSVDAKTGKPDTAFGENGKADLHKGLDRDVDDLFIVSNSPGVVFEDLLILGSRVSESTGAAPGHIRAFNVRTGEVEWIFHTVPQPGQFGYDTWPEDAWKRIGGANAWSGMSLDKERGMVFVPTGSAAYDFYGGDRHGDNLFANCIIALNARTGERIWHYQTVHHDLWDRDLPAPPNLVTVVHDGKKIDAVAQIAKSALIFLLDRETGEPLFPIEEVPVAASRLNGEQASPTQPIPTKPAPFSRHTIEEKDLNSLTEENFEYAKAIWANSLKGSPYIPPSEEGTFVFPGFDGGGEWGGAAFDPETGNLIVNASEMAWILQMVPYSPESDGLMATVGESLYQVHCMSCHGKDLKGASIFTVPSLADVGSRLSKSQILQTLSSGKGMMPSFGHLEEDERKAITAFLTKSNEKIPAGSALNDKGKKESWPYPYFMTGYNRFKTPDGYPAISPPWGTLNAINLNTGELSWKVTLGEYEELTEKGIPPTGTENYGGPVVTAGGLVFIAATKDSKFRAFDKNTGEVLFEYELEAPGFATPATYSVDGKQYVVIAAGGGKIGMHSGDQYVAFAL